MIKASKIDIASATFFVIAFMFAKSQFLLPSFLAMISNLISLSLYFIGYILWSIAALCFPQNKAPKKPLLGIQDFKQPYLAASLLGFLATVCCVLALSAPIFLLPAAWIYFLSNCLWCLAELHKMIHPPFWTAENPPQKQQYHFIYTSLICFLSFLSAVATTLTFCIPAATMSLFIASVVIGAVLGFVALSFWFAYSLSGPTQKRLSYQDILVNLDADPMLIETSDYALEQSIPRPRFKTFRSPLSLSVHAELDEEELPSPRLF